MLNEPSPFLEVLYINSVALLPGPKVKVQLIPTFCFGVIPAIERHLQTHLRIIDQFHDGLNDLPGITPFGHETGPSMLHRLSRATSV